MDLQAVLTAVRATLSADHVCGVTREFLAQCGWELEIGSGTLEVPEDAELLVSSAAAVVSGHGFGDHVEAVVYLGVERLPHHVVPGYGVLRLYLNPAGEMITEDRYTPDEWRNRRT